MLVTFVSPLHNKISSSLKPTQKEIFLSNFLFGQIYFISRINLNPGSARIFSTFEWIVISAQLGSTGFTVTGSMNPKFFQFTETTSRLSLKDFKEIRLLFFEKKTVCDNFLGGFVHNDRKFVLGGQASGSRVGTTVRS